MKLKTNTLVFTLTLSLQAPAKTTISSVILVARDHASEKVIDISQDPKILPMGALIEYVFDISF